MHQQPDMGQLLSAFVEGIKLHDAPAILSPDERTQLVEGDIASFQGKICTAISLALNAHMDLDPSNPQGLIELVNEFHRQALVHSQPSDPL